MREMTLPTKCHLTLTSEPSRKRIAHNNFRLCTFEISSWRPTETSKNNTMLIEMS